LTLRHREPGKNCTGYAAKAHGPVPTILFQQIGAKDFREAPSCPAPEQIHLEQPVSCGDESKGMERVGVTSICASDPCPRGRPGMELTAGKPTFREQAANTAPPRSTKRCYQFANALMA
jgi:hypothetical protein